MRDWPAAALRAGGAPVEAALGPGEVLRYRLPLPGGTFLRLVVDQEDVDAEIALFAPAADGGDLVLDADRPTGDGGAELMMAATDRAGDYLLEVRGPPAEEQAATAAPGRIAARIEALHPADDADRRRAEVYRRSTAARHLLPEQPEEAIAVWTEALAAWRELGEVELEGEARFRLARLHFARREWAAAADFYRRAAEAFVRADDVRWQASARASLAASLQPQAEAEAAIAEAAGAVDLARRAGDRLTEARALHVLGQAHADRGELQAAIDRYQQALARWPARQRGERAATLHNLGVLYARFLHDPGRGRDLLVEARDAWPPEREDDRAGTLSQLGRLDWDDGRLGEARRHFDAALALPGSSRCRRALTLARLALVDDAEGDPAAADARLGEAFAAFAERPCPRDEPTARLLAAGLAETRGDAGDARAAFARCRALFAAAGERAREAESLAGVARAERVLGDGGAALRSVGEALAILEGVRPTVLSEDLRTSFFTQTREMFDLEIDLLLDRGAAEEAWAAAEQARARTLRDLLAEAGAGPRRGADPALVDRERALQRGLNALESARLATNRDDALAVLRRRMDDLVAELEAVRGELRRADPPVEDPAPPAPAALRRALLDDDDLLLEFRLGEAASAVWAVTRDAVRAYRLPPRRELEPVAIEAAGWLKSLRWPGGNPPAVCELSRTLLADVAPLLGRRRLVVVADGALEAVPFAALPDPTAAAPCREAPPLVERHEIVALPSAQALAVQRRRLAGRRPAAGWVAVVADPVYEADDERLAAVDIGSPSDGDAAGAGFRRLAHAAEEADAVLAGLPAGRTLAATGFAASRTTVAGGALAGFRILHFATHGVLDAEQPLLSLLALSRFDAGGRPRDGTLPAHEIYGLDLPAELVVLSACDTGGGRLVAGEGLVSGLPRAFLAAGAARVLVSLWAVDDESTRDLMARFYAGLLGDGLPPARALQEAQRALRRAGLPPRGWAGFVLLGDWRPLPALAP